MKTSGLSVHFLNAPLFALLWLANHAVISGQLSAPQVVQATYGGSTTVPCQYHPYYRFYTKYWCRGPVYDYCTIVQKTPKTRKNSRCFIVDNRDAGIFNVTMTSLRSGDEDMYWCVIATVGRNIYTGVRLILSHAVTTTTEKPVSTATTTPTTPTTLTPSTSPIHDVTRLYSWWPILRWIIFISMLLWLIMMQIIVMSRNATQKKRNMKYAYRYLEM